MNLVGGFKMRRGGVFYKGIKVLTIEFKRVEEGGIRITGRNSVSLNLLLE